MAVAPFKEDFFERVIDVKWETEPEVFWLVGSGPPVFVNGQGSTSCCVYRSSDGKHWYGTLYGQMVHQGISSYGAIIGGAWMRKGLQEGAQPMWILCGSTSRQQGSNCVGFSTDGEIFDKSNITIFDLQHWCEDIYPATGGVNLIGYPTLSAFLHQDTYFSSNGETWRPSNYHGGEGASTFSALAVHEVARSVVPARRSRIFTAVGPDLDPSNVALPVPDASLARASTFAEINPLAPGTSVRDKILFKGTGIYTTGKVRKGPHRGKRLTIVIDPYHYPSGGGAHGDNTVRVYVHEKNGGQTMAGVFNTRISRSVSIGYGHYTFVVTGADSKQRSKISWSEDGVRWHPVDLGPYGQINGIAVGPRPSDAPPKPPRADEITNNGNTVGTGKPPVLS